MLKRLFKPRPARAAGQTLYQAAVDQARHPQFYRDLGAPDRIDARFELYALHVLLLVHRLGGQGAEAAEVSQALFDAFLSALDNTLRELGVGDLSVAPKMRKLGAAIYGRVLAHGDALKDAAGADLDALIARTVFADETAVERAGPIADYVRRAKAALASQPRAEILEGRPAGPPIAP
jgi:cytochrome b pre-mRNA-processing protein 3